MLIDCDRCEVRGRACGDCVVGVLIGVPGVPGRVTPDTPEGRPSGAPTVHLDAPERRALEVLADQGLVPRLRLVAAPVRRVTESGRKGGAVRDAG
jgi:hypothetical protein